MLCVMYTLRSNNCVLGLKSQFAIFTCSHLNPFLRYIGDHDFIAIVHTIKDYIIVYLGIYSVITKTVSTVGDNDLIEVVK